MQHGPAQTAGVCASPASTFNADVFDVGWAGCSKGYGPHMGTFKQAPAPPSSLELVAGEHCVR